MSGPKGYGYSVVSEEELRRREDEAREARCQQHVITLAGLIGQLHQFGSKLPQEVKRPLSKNHDALIAWEVALQDGIADAQERVRDESAVAIMRRLNATREAVDASAVKLGGRQRAVRDAAARTPVQDPELARVSTEVERVVQLVVNLRDPVQRDELTQMAQGVLGTTIAAQAKGDLLTLKTKVSNAMRVQECRELAAQAVLEIAAVETPEADLLRERAAGSSTAQDVSDIKRDVATLARQEASETDAAFVQDALEEALNELGFSIGEGFSLSQYGAVAVADHADHPGYGLRFQVSPMSGRLLTRVVAGPESTPEKYAQAERETCDQVHAVAERLSQHGVSAELMLERQPGETVVTTRETSTHRSRTTRPGKTRRRNSSQERGR